MEIYKITLNISSLAAMRDMDDVNQLHRSLFRLFSKSEDRMKSDELLWRVEPTPNKDGNPIILVQSSNPPNLERFTEKDWAVSIEGPVRMQGLLGAIRAGDRLRFRLRGNPTKKIRGKNFALTSQAEKIEWLQKKAQVHGFDLETLQISQSGLIRGYKRDSEMFFNSTLFDGTLTVRDAAEFEKTILGGIGRGKAFGFGLLSITRA